ncbi:MAG TPA: hypothetical protein VF163_14250 [Micromonosporaceae bacterium]
MIDSGGGGDAMRWLAHVCVAVAVVCAANIVSTVVGGGPLIGVGLLTSAQVLVVAAGCLSSAWYSEAGSPRPPRRDMFRELPRTAVVAGMAVTAAFVAVAVYDSATSGWAQSASARTVSGFLGGIATLFALGTYGTDLLRRRRYRAATPV